MKGTGPWWSSGLERQPHDNLNIYLLDCSCCVQLNVAMSSKYLNRKCSHCQENNINKSSYRHLFMGQT